MFLLRGVNAPYPTTPATLRRVALEWENHAEGHDAREIDGERTRPLSNVAAIELRERDLLDVTAKRRGDIDLVRLPRSRMIALARQRAWVSLQEIAEA